jgi:hypothetical protein
MNSVIDTTKPKAKEIRQLMKKQRRFIEQSK